MTVDRFCRLKRWRHCCHNVVFEGYPLSQQSLSYIHDVHSPHNTEQTGFIQFWWNPPLLSLALWTTCTQFNSQVYGMLLMGEWRRRHTGWAKLS